jgi:hypothetical protein
MKNAPPSFTCPRCGFVSYNTNDIAHAYCVRCHVFTNDEVSDMSSVKPGPKELQLKALREARAARVKAIGKPKLKLVKTPKRGGGRRGK